MKYDIKNRWTGKALFTAEIDATPDDSDAVKKRKAVLWAIRNGNNLRDADMSGANMSDANMRGVNMSGADMRGANMSYASMRGANMRDANMRDANMRDANMRGADMSASGIINCGQRSDGYDFFIHTTAPEHPVVIAGCRYLSIPDARQHWIKTRSGTRLGDESLALLDHGEAMAAIAKKYEVSA